MGSSIIGLHENLSNSVCSGLRSQNEAFVPSHNLVHILIIIVFSSYPRCPKEDCGDDLITEDGANVRRDGFYITTVNGIHGIIVY